MSAAVAYLLVVGFLVALAARAGEELLRIAGRPTRAAWLGSLVLLTVLTIRAVLSGPPSAPRADSVVFDVPANAVAVVPHSSLWNGISHIIAASRDFASGLPQQLAAGLGEVPASAASGFGLAWGVLAIAVLTWLALVYWRFGRATRRLPAAELHGVHVRVSERAGPAVVGLRDPQIVVPAWLLGATPDEQRLAIAHEREHIRARDPFLLMAGCLAAAVLPWHPAAWWMLGRLRLAIEVDCDRRVIASGVARRAYGTTLIDIASRCARLPLGVPALADHRTHLERRLIAMVPRQMSYRRTRFAALGAAALLMIAAACEARLPSSPEIEAMDVAQVEGNVMTKVALGSDTLAAYFIDGLEVSPDAARALAAEDIGSIRIMKALAGNEIHITTKAAVARGTPESPLRVKMAQRVDSVGQLPSKRVGVTVPDSGFTGLILIDGEPVTQQALKRLSPDDIASIDVLKGDAASRLYVDPKAANGVIRVTTKR